MVHDYKIDDGIITCKVEVPNGYKIPKSIEINGIQQWLSIRGQHANHPIILFVHGGPGSPMTPMIYKYQKYLEDEYTIVNWEQRSTGRTYFLNKAKETEIQNQLCIEQERKK